MKRSLFLSGLFVLGVAAFSAAFPAAAAEAVTEPARDYHTEFRAKVAPLHDQLYAKRSELAAQYDDGSADEAKVQALIKDVADLQARIYAAELEYESRRGAEFASDGDVRFESYGGHHGGRGHGDWYRGSDGWGHGGGRGYGRRHGGHGGHW